MENISSFIDMATINQAKTDVDAFITNLTTSNLNETVQY